MHIVADKRLALKLLLIPMCLVAFIFVGSQAAYAASGTKYEVESNNTYGLADTTYDDYDNYGRISSKTVSFLMLQHQQTSATTRC